ncbi:TlpA disulfide reductase family protein [Pedobacter gandavensis]|uniref:TlpA family protein disulfide reductase n=1 Tax=Pedobacter gandavensis TaxID=2679963 RepID=UPI0029309E98|nr:TlpA disulfide reductase family protein [Pedobacter gandavensis]
MAKAYETPAFLSFIFVFLISACQQKPKENATNLAKIPATEITVSVNFQPDAGKAKDQVVYLAYLDQLNDRQTFEITPDNKQGQAFKIWGKTPVFVMDWTPNQTYYVFYPAEKISITPGLEALAVSSSVEDDTRKNELGFFEALGQQEITEKSAKLKNTLSKISKHGDSSGPSATRMLVLMDLIKNKKLKDPVVSYQFIKSRYQQRLDFLESYTKTKPVTSDYKKLMDNFFKYEFSADLLKIINNARAKKILVNDSLKNAVASMLTTLNCDSCLNIPTYRYALKNYLTYAFSTEKYPTLKAKVDFINQEFKGETRDFCLFLALKTVNPALSPENQKMLQQFVSQNGNEAYKSQIKKNLAFYISPGKSGNAKETVIQDINGKQRTFEKLVAANKGKVIVLDFWASWCVPCKAEIPYSKRLHEDLKNENVMMVYLSLDESPAAWLKSVKALGIEENSFRVEQAFKSTLAKGLGISGIPHYVIIDKEGQMVNTDAPRPSDPVLKKDILALVKQP